MNYVFEVVDYSSGEQYWTLGLFGSFSDAIAAIRAVQVDPESGAMPDVFDPYGQFDTGSDATLHVRRRSVDAWDAEPKHVATVEIHILLGGDDQYYIERGVKMI